MNLPLEMLPKVNATLNGLSAVFLTTGYFFIRKKQVQTHRLFMGLAFATSVLFLASYLFYHAHHGATRFPGTGWAKVGYLTILISHTILAIVIVPLVLRTLWLALSSRFEAHRRLARWTFPLWLYVSVTGVIVYWMLYEVAWSCPMCKEAIAAGSDPVMAKQLLQGWGRSIYLMMAVPYLIVAGITFAIVRSTRRAAQRRAAP